MNLKLIRTLTTVSQKKLYNILVQFLKRSGYMNIIKSNMYIIAEGEIPVTLIAHLDTVSEDFYNTVPDMCLYDKDQDILHVVTGGTLDDRLGVYSIIEIISAGYRPNIIFTLGEELGGIGAEELVQRFKKSPFSNYFMIELDRRGQKDSVYYTCGNKKFEEYINSFGFETAKGSFSDCLIIGETWDIAAVNLSCGYMLEHTALEYAYLEWTHETIEKVKNILEDWVDADYYPCEPFKYNIKSKNKIKDYHLIF